MKVLSILLPGDQFGEMSLFEDKPRIASVKALSDVTLLSIKRDNFRKLISNDLDSGMKLLSAIMSATFNRLSATNKQLACLYEIGKQ